MKKDLRELRVFMASPGDLTDERDALRNLERRLNAMFRDRGIRVSIEGWEEVQPDAGAPQQLINPLVHDCDVFIGLLNVRWGTPTDDDSSGFSEEFNIALKRRQESGTTPVIGMYFREIDPERLRDKGPQLEAVLAFKERVETERLVLHKSFSGADNLALEVMNFLLPHTLRIADEVSASTADLGSGTSGSTPANDGPKALESAEVKADTDEAEDSAGEPDSVQLQIISALSSFSNLFLGGASIASETRDRVTLVAKAFALDAGTLDSHHVNRLFRNRENLELTLGEVRIWYRTFFENYGLAERGYRIVPIWGLIPPDRFDERFIDELATLATDDNPNVVRGVLRLMTEHEIRPKPFWKSDPAGGDGEGASVEPRTTETPAARWAGLFEKFPGIDSTLNYMVAVASLGDVELLKSVADSDAVDDRSRELIRTAIDVMAGKVADVEDLAPTRYSGNDTSSLRDLVVDSVPKLQAEQWMTLLTGTHRRIAVAAALQIVEHENVSAERLKTITELKSAEVEQALVERARRDTDWAALQIKELTDRDKYGSADMISRLMAASVPKGSLELLDRDETLDVRAWVALTIQNPQSYVESAREVLDGTSEWLDKRKAPLVDKYAVIADHMTATAKGAACLVLSQAVEITELDVERVGAELRRDSYVSRSSALRALIAMAKRLDAHAKPILPGLGDLSVLDNYGFSDDAEFVLDSPLAGMVAPVWAASEIRTLQELGRAWRFRQPDMSDADLEEALYLDNETLRMIALDQLMSRWSDDQLRGLLERYGDQNRQWWYNIIAALDERLYGFGRQGDRVRSK